MTSGPLTISHFHAVVAVTDEFTPTTEAAPTPSLHPHKLQHPRETTNSYSLLYKSSTQQNRKIGVVAASEIHDAKMKWIKTCQKQLYWKELSCLTSKSNGSKQSRLIRQLRLFLDEYGIIRCGGRIYNAPLSQLAKFPYLLPPKHPFIALIIYSVHIRLFHAV